MCRAQNVINKKILNPILDIKIKYSQSGYLKLESTMKNLGDFLGFDIFIYLKYIKKQWFRLPWYSMIQNVFKILIYKKYLSLDV